MTSRKYLNKEGNRMGLRRVLFKEKVNNK
jgi:hypothetical protein